MKYNPDKHHRHSTRLPGYDDSSPGAYFITICTHQRQCLFGEIVDGEMQLNPLGQMVRSRWLKLPQHKAHLEWDAWVIMPNHIHGILILTTPLSAEPGVAFGRELIDKSTNHLSNAAPLPPRLGAGAVGQLY